MVRRGRPRKWEVLALDFIQEKRDLGFSKSWARKIKNVLLVDCPGIIDETDPAKVTRKEYIKYISYLVEKYENADYRRQKASALNQFLARHGNYVYQSVTLNWEKWQPKNVTWLTWAEVLYLWTLPMSPVQRAMIWMMSRMGCRRIEVLRARIEDIDLSRGKFYIRGKGGSGTKGRTIHIPPSGMEFIPQYNQYREGCLQRFYEINGLEGKPPKNWTIFWTKEKRPRLTTLKKTVFDDLVKDLSERSGLRFTSHTFRRAFSRHIFMDMDNKAEKCIKVTGHSETKSFYRYIGINDDDVRDIMMRTEDKKYEIMQESV